MKPIAFLGLGACVVATDGSIYSIWYPYSYPQRGRSGYLRRGYLAVTPPQQKRLLRLGDRGFLLSLNASALYGGVALGSALGGVVLSGTDSIATLCFLAAALEVGALVIAGLDRAIGGRLEPRGSPS